ncbi:helix-turn-helix domain-containing protein [Chryseobacterium sp. SIMBA_029]|uniref:helix-turn-helix domain-containing protein n=1 Tax=Chryseobacterium sp. SIMBA_029 TaxID=3085772 RepID=UPI003979516E
MDRKVQKVGTKPDYRKIYSDIIGLRHPEKSKYCRAILSKEHISDLDVIRLNDIIFSQQNRENEIFNQKHRAYNEEAILQMLNYQEENSLNNTQLAANFKLSRNTVAKWKKIYSKSNNKGK